VKNLMAPCPDCGGEIRVKFKLIRKRRRYGVVIQQVPRAQCKRCLRTFRNSGAEMDRVKKHEPT
jgi:hypothetical protein